jgi:signal transduction histidine kinase
VETESKAAMPPAGEPKLDPSMHQRKSKTSTRVKDLVSLSRVSAAISSLTDLETVLRVGLNSVLSIMNGEIGGIMLIDEETRTLSYRVYHGLSDKYATEMRLRLGEGIAGKVAQSGRSTLLEDISLEPEAARLDLIGTEDLRAFISIPLRARERILGVMNVASHIPRRFTREDLHLLGSVGDQLGIAIEQAKLYEQLRKSRERYRQLARQILVAEEEERRRIARELHDETSQTMAGLALNLQTLLDMADMLGIQDAEFKSRLKKAHSLAIQTGTEVSRLIVNLRPGLLDTLGVVAAIRQYAESSLTPLNINISFEFEEMRSPLPPEVEVGLFRWAQQAIGNIAQHSQAKNATISMRPEGNELVLSISDDGKGFDVSQITGIEPTGRGAGLFGAKERVRLLGGECSIQSQLGQGTTATARIPMIGGITNAKDKSINSR